MQLSSVAAWFAIAPAAPRPRTLDRTRLLRRLEQARRLAVLSGQARQSPIQAVSAGQAVDDRQSPRQLGLTLRSLPAAPRLDVRA